MALTITIPGAVEATIGATAPAVLTIGVGTPGATGPAGPAGAAGQGVPVGGTAGQFLTKIDSTNYNTDWTTVNLSAYAVKANNLSDLASASTARTNLGLGTMATATAADYSTTTAANLLYAPIAAGQPTSGTVGQVLTKNSGTNYDSSWATLIPGDRYVTTSSTSLTIGNGTMSLTVGTGLSYSSQQDVVISYDAANHMHAVVTSYNSGTGAMVVDVQHHTGSGTYTSWTVNVGGTTPLQTVEWGEVLGVIGDQSDLATALNNKLETSTAASTYAALAGATFTGEVSTPASTTSSAGLSILPGTAPTSPVNGDIWNTGSDLQVRLGGVTETIAEQSWVSTNYAAKAGATFTGLVGTVASTTATAGLNVPHGVAPTSPVNGDIWTTTSGLFARINAGTQQFPALSTNNTFSNASSTYGSSTATGTINVASGATISASTKAVNIGTGGVVGSTTTTIIGPVLGASTTTIGATTAASTLNLATGATLTATTKAVNIGTAGVAGSTTNIAIGSTTGTSTTTLQGNLTTTGTTTAIANSTAAQTIAIGNGSTASGTKTIEIGGYGSTGTTTNVSIAHNVAGPSGVSSVTIGTATPASTVTLNGNVTASTQAVDTNSTALATTAYVVGQAGSATPLVNGTAAVGTSLRYARQDHVHGTDTSRAPLASPTFTGTVTIPAGASISGFAPLAAPTFTGVPAAPTAAVDTNTTQIATTAYVVGNGYLKSATASSTYAPLASPALTGTPTAPTATAGTNTTQIATTAFVLANAGSTSFATNAQTIVGTSTTTALSPSLIPASVTRPELRSLAHIFYTAVSGSGVVTSAAVNFGQREMYLGSLATGRANFTYGIPGVNSVNMSRSSNNQINFSKKIWLSGKCMCGATIGATNYNGDSNTYTRVTLGGYGSQTTGDMTSKGIGWRKQGGTSSFFNLTVHNGTTLTNVASSITQSDGRTIDWQIYSDGAGNVTLYIDGAEVATTSSGPTGLGTTNASSYREQVEAATAPTVRSVIEATGGWLYIEG